MEKQVLVGKLVELAKDPQAFEAVMAIKTKEEAEKYLKENNWDATVAELEEAIKEYRSTERELSEAELDQAAGGVHCGSTVTSGGTHVDICWYEPGEE